MADIPVRPPPPPPPLPPGWAEHKAPSGHTYYYNTETKKSTYTRPVSAAAAPSFGTHPPPPLPSAALGPTASDRPIEAPATQSAFDPRKQIENLIFGGAPQHSPHNRGQHYARGGHRGGFRGGHGGFQDKKQQPEDRPKHRQDIPGCAPWVLVKTKLGRRFVWNKDTNKSLWKFPPDVMTAVVEFDRIEREKRERRERGEPSDVEDDAAMAEIEADLAAAEDEMQQEIVEVVGEEGMEDEEEYEEVEVTDDEGEEAEHPSKRQKTEELGEHPPMDIGEDDLAWQLAQMEEMEGGYDEEYDEEEEEEPPLSEEDCKALFKELLDDTRISPYTPWEKVLEGGILYDDERYKALPNMKARKDCFDEWTREKIHLLKEQKAKQQKLDPRGPYLAFLDRYATPKLYWPEFRRKYKKEPEMKDTKLSDKEKEKLYRDHIKRLGMRSSELKSDLAALLKAQPLVSLNRSTTLDTLPSAVLTDLRYISLSPSTREALIETYISTLPRAPEGGAASAEEEAEAAKRREERRRRERALAERERRVREERRKQERELAYGRGRLREEEIEIERAMNVGKGGLRAQLSSS
ncbi:hypothetical protein BU26DRAFT_456043 [Trematosphaeria pertusa]|uniref:WW domain-containing protein n=1 Tax=Trematosphaeria pertusa TaxID=390896 RepID=A0A6A6IJL1_9PLEO|nr:uncharacterized protein BU26DRAFT_456043 [Trematosphaeria pertusa]KAF2250409.1 hypothetical protein BU26DRAFT_456043 [Trematosphaeria pertusa]